MSRNSGYYGPSDSDLSKGFAVIAIAFLLMTAWCIVGLCASCSSEPEITYSYEEELAAASKTTLIDTSDSWTMHQLGLPTRSDLMGYHMYGRWGFSAYEGESGDDGNHIYTRHTYEAVPGNLEAWDELYCIDGDNPAYLLKTSEQED